jgi:hypothetical protein
MASTPSPTLPACGGGFAGHFDGLLVGLQAVERGHWAKGFLLRDDHVGRHIGQHCRLDEAAGERAALAAGDDPGTFLDRIGNMSPDLLDPFHIDGRMTPPGSSKSL